MKRRVALALVLFGIAVTIAVGPKADPASAGPVDEVSGVVCVGSTYSTALEVMNYVRCSYGGEDVTALYRIQWTSGADTPLTCTPGIGGVLCTGIPDNPSSSATTIRVNTPSSGAIAWPITWTQTYPDPGAAGPPPLFEVTVCGSTGPCHDGAPTPTTTTTTTTPTGSGSCVGATLTYRQMVTVAMAGGFTDPEVIQLAIAVAYAESGFRVSVAPSNTNGSVDRGLWQINTIHRSWDTNRLLSEPVYNAQAAFSISSGGTNWSPWVAYTNNRHLPFMDAAGDAVLAGGEALTCDGEVLPGTPGGGGGNPDEEGGCGGLWDFNITCWLKQGLRAVFVPNPSSFTNLKDTIEDGISNKLPFSYVTEVGAAGWNFINGSRAQVSSHRNDCLPIFAEGFAPGQEGAACADTDIEGVSIMRGLFAAFTYAGTAYGVAMATLRIVNK